MLAGLFKSMALLMYLDIRRRKGEAFYFYGLRRRTAACINGEEGRDGGVLRPIWRRYQSATAGVRYHF